MTGLRPLHPLPIKRKSCCQRSQTVRETYGSSMSEYYTYQNASAGMAIRLSAPTMIRSRRIAVVGMVRSI